MFRLNSNKSSTRQRHHQWYVAKNVGQAANPGPPNKFIKDKSKTYKTKEETNEKREVFSNVVIGLLVISFVVPMVQYFGYVAGDPDFDDN